MEFDAGKRLIYGKLTVDFTFQGIDWISFTANPATFGKTVFRNVSRSYSGEN